MGDYQLNATGEDLLVQNGDLVLTTSKAQAAAQRLQIALGIGLREWALDQTEGLPYRGEIRAKAPSLLVIRSRFLARILRDPDVVEVVELEVELDRLTRELSVSFRALVLEQVPGLDVSTVTVVGSGAIANGDPDLLVMIEPSGGYQ